MQRGARWWVGSVVSVAMPAMLLVGGVVGCGGDRSQEERAADPVRSPAKATPAKATKAAATRAAAQPSPDAPPIDFGRERLIVASVALATPAHWSLHPCEDPCVIVMRSNAIVGGIMPFVKLEVMPDMTGTLAEIRANGARSYSNDGAIPVEQSNARFGEEEGFDLTYQVNGTPFRQIARHALRGHTLFVLTAAGPDNQRDAPVWQGLRGILDDARFMGPPPSAAELRRIRQVRPDLQREAARQARHGTGPAAPGQPPAPPSPAGSGPAAPPR